MRHTADITVEQRAGGGFKALGEFLAAQWVAFGPVLGSVFLVVLASARRSGATNAYGSLPLVQPALWGRGLQARRCGATPTPTGRRRPSPRRHRRRGLAAATGRRRPLAAGLAINLGLVAAVYHWPTLLRLAEVHNAAKKDPFPRPRQGTSWAANWPPVAAHPGAVVVAENRTLLAHMIYELRCGAPPPAGIPWGRRPTTKLSTDLRPYRGGDVLFLTQDSLAVEVAARFPRRRPSPPWKRPRRNPRPDRQGLSAP